MRVRGRAIGQARTARVAAYSSSSEGQGILSGIGYVPLPAELNTQVSESVSTLS